MDRGCQAHVSGTKNSAVKNLSLYAVVTGSKLLPVNWAGHNKSGDIWPSVELAYMPGGLYFRPDIRNRALRQTELNAAYEKTGLGRVEDSAG